MNTKNYIYYNTREPAHKNQVGLFYFLWLGEHGRHKPYDISKITAEHPDAGYHPDADYWGGIGTYHHWGEPFYGYYYSDDEWVVRRHMKLIIQSGVDFLYFDTTNACIYEKNAKLVMSVLQEYHDAGHRVPGVMFYTNTASGKTVDALYKAIYQPGFCRDVWYKIDGKPAIIAFEEELTDELRGFFTVKKPQWPNEPDKVGGWPWMDFTKPQRIFVDENGNGECISVSVAQHPQLRFGDSVLYGEETNCGRAYHDGANDKSPDAYKNCCNFNEQFKRALEANVPYTLVTGWNEWIAGQWQGIPERPVMFVDCANYEYSRDIEMMRGGYFDNYYKALCDWCARLKGLTTAEKLSDGKTIRVNGYSDGAFHRNHEGYGCVYKNDSGRNSLRYLDISGCDKTFAIRLTTADKIDYTDHCGTFMEIYIRVGDKRYTVRDYDTMQGTASLVSGNERKTIPTEFTDNSISVTIPWDGVKVGESIYLKAADSREKIASAEDFYDKGDVLPLGYAEIEIIRS